jgi:hypothetical protein
MSKIENKDLLQKIVSLIEEAKEKPFALLTFIVCNCIGILADIFLKTNNKAKSALNTENI